MNPFDIESEFKIGSKIFEIDRKLKNLNRGESTCIGEYDNTIMIRRMRSVISHYGKLKDKKFRTISNPDTNKMWVKRVDLETLEYSNEQLKREANKERQNRT